VWFSEQSTRKRLSQELLLATQHTDTIKGFYLSSSMLLTPAGHEQGDGKTPQMSAQRGC